jgi:hypothetical protein
MKSRSWSSWYDGERQILLKDHPNILKLFETFEDEENLYMLIE